MKVFVILAALVGITFAAAPAPPQGWHSSGRLLFLPAHLETSASAEANTTETKQRPQSEEQQSSQILDSGEYYILLPDGRLQMVKYETAALLEDTGKQTSGSSQQPQPSFQQYRNPFPAETSNYQQQSQQVKQPAPFQVQYVQFPLPGSQYTQTKLELKEEEKAEKKSEDQKIGAEEETSGFEANIQYRDVKPVSGPIYAYNPTPLIRVLRR